MDPILRARDRQRMPSAVRGLVPRTVLFDRLSAAGEGGVTLVSAPAGSGKTTLLRSWVDDAGLGDRVAWVSVERDERDAQRFWLSVVGELSGAVGRDGFVQKLSAAPDFDGDAVVEAPAVGPRLARASRCVLVIDDLHELSSAEALAQLEVPAGAACHRRCGSCSRRATIRRSACIACVSPASSPSFGRPTCASRRRRRAICWRSAGSCCRMLAWRCCTSGPKVGRPGCGWRRSRSRAIPSPSGSSTSSPAASAPSRSICWPRCSIASPSDVRQAAAAHVDPGAGERPARRLRHRRLGLRADPAQGSRRRNAFVVSLDVGRSWFRYHHLFADLLRLELRRTAPDEVAPLHRAAAEWFAEHGYVVDAIEHAQAAGDWQQAAQLLADNDISLALDGRGETTRALLAAFPAEAASAECGAGQRFSPASRSNAGRSRRPSRIWPPPNGTPRRCPTSGAAASTSSSALERLTLARRRGDFGAVLAGMRSLEAASKAGTPSEVAFGNDIRAADADGPRHRRAVVIPGRGGPPAPRGGCGAGAPDRPAVRGDRLPRTPGDRGRRALRRPGS